MRARSFDDTREHVECRLEAELESRDAAAVVHVGTAREPTVRYLLSVATDSAAADGSARHAVADDDLARHAVAYDGTAWSVRSAPPSASHPVIALTETLSNHEPRSILTPAGVPHDAALHLENAGLELASTDVLERARATKTVAERDRLDQVQAAASAGIRRAASVLASATVSDGTLVTGGDRADDRDEPVTHGRLRRAVDQAIVAAGGFPDANTRIEVDADDGASVDDRASADDRTSTSVETLRPGEPIVVDVVPREPDGYYGGLARTFVVESEGGRERRAHVGVTHAFRSAAAMLTADSESVTAVEADLEAEVRAFGFTDADDVATDVSGLGLEPRERPLEGGDEVDTGSVVRLEAAARVADGQWVRVADVLAVEESGVEWLETPSRSLEPATLLE